MIEEHVENSGDARKESGSARRGINRQTAYSEPLWVDALKTLGVAGIMLLIVILVGSTLTLMMIAPWGRASPECSMWCVLGQEVESWFSDAPS